MTNFFNTRQFITSLAASSALVVSSAWLSTLSAKAQTFTEPQLLTSQRVAQAAAIRTTSAQNQTLYLNNDRSYSYNLVVTSGGNFNGFYIPAGATIIGQYEPAPGGLRYVARGVEVEGRTYSISGVSETIEDVKDPRDTSAGAIAGDAGIGAAGGAILGEILGDIDAPEVIGGAAAGAIVGNVTADRVVVIRPDEPIILYSR
ncbi:MAG: hypothetical protein Kow00121_62710 [Elainellaceae cyanobacterium]